MAVIGKQMCERCETVMRPIAGYQCGGDEWMAYRCGECGDSRRVFGHYDTKGTL